MRVRARLTGILGFALVVGVAAFWAATPGHAACTNANTVAQGIFAPSAFVGCGNNADIRAFVWRHRQAIQRTALAGAANTAGGGTDSGARATLADGGILQDDPAGSGGVASQFDWGNSGVDGCATDANSADTDAAGCGRSGLSLPPVNFMVGSRDASNPFVALAAVASVDGNEPTSTWFLENAGAQTSGDPDPCNDAFQTLGANITCGTIPTPNEAGQVGACDATGCNLSISIAPHTVPFVDDCDIAFSKNLSTVCPRNLYAGRALYYKRGPCGLGAAPADTRSFATALPTSVTENFRAFGEDANLNGTLDAGEDANANGRLDPILIPGNLQTTTTVHIPKLTIAGPADPLGCVYLGVGLVLDGTPATTPAVGQPVVTPYVSVNPFPISLDNATPVADRIANLRASRSGGKANVSWDTGVELSISGFNLVGFKKNGSTVALNPSLISAKEGTTGGSASYSIDLTAAALKGAAKVALEVKHTNGSTDRTDPVSFE